MKPGPCLLVILAACGGSDPPPGLPDADLGEVTVETYPACCADPIEDPEMPLAGVQIVVNDVDGHVELTTTDADGRATVALQPGATVTAVYRLHGNSARLLSFAGVEPGDHLRFGGDEPSITLVPTATMRVDFPPVAGASGYEVVSSCSTIYPESFQAYGEVQHTSICDPASEDLYLYAYADVALTHHGVLEDVAFTDGGRVALDAWEPVGSLVVDAAGIPPDATEVSVSAMVLGNADVVHGQFATGAPTGDTYSHTFPWPSRGDAMAAGAIVVTPTGAHGRVDPFSPGATSHVIDDLVVLPAVSAFDFSVGEERFDYTLDGGEAYDMTVAFVSYHRTEVADIFWQVVAPPGAVGPNALVLPDLPPELDDLDLRTALTGAGAIELRDLDAIADFDEARTRTHVELDNTKLQGGNFYQPRPEQ